MKLTEAYLQVLAEEDKKKAINALEEASMQYLQERDEKKKLEVKNKINKIS